MPKKWRRSVAALYSGLSTVQERYQVVALRPVSSDGGGAGATSVDATTDTRLQKSLARIETESLELGVCGLAFYHTQ